MPRRGGRRAAAPHRFRHCHSILPDSPRLPHWPTWGRPRCDALHPLCVPSHSFVQVDPAFFGHGTRKNETNVGALNSYHCDNPSLLRHLPENLRIPALAEPARPAAVLRARPPQARQANSPHHATQLISHQNRSYTDT